MIRVLLAISVTCASIPAVAADPAPAPATPPPAPEAAAATAAPAAEPYVLKTRSVFEVAPDARAPFWPIGWVKGATHTPVKTTVKAAPAAPVLQADQFTVSSVLLGNPALATINGRSFAQGEILPVVLDGVRLNLVLRSIQDGGVVLEYDDNVLFVPLRRQEVPQHAPVFQPKPGQKQEIILDSGPKRQR